MALESKDRLEGIRLIHRATVGCMSARICASISAISMQARRPDLAEAALLKATALDPSHARAWIDLGAVYGVTRQFTKARNALHRAVQLVPESVKALNAFAALLIDTGDRDGAVAALMSVLRIEPSNRRALQNLKRVEVMAPR